MNNIHVQETEQTPNRINIKKHHTFGEEVEFGVMNYSYNSVEGSLCILTSISHELWYCDYYDDFYFFHTHLYSLTNKSPLTLVCSFLRGKAHHWVQLPLNKEGFFSFLSSHDDSKSVMSIRAAASPLGLLCRNRKSHTFPRADADLNQDPGLSEQSTVWFSDALAAWLKDSC